MIFNNDKGRERRKEEIKKEGQIEIERNVRKEKEKRGEEIRERESREIEREREGKGERGISL